VVAQVPAGCGVSEDQMVTQIDIDIALEKLDPADRDMIVLIFRLERPVDWGIRAWPPKYSDIGDYVGRKHELGPLSEAAIRYRRDVVFAQWRGLRGNLRRDR
jgi:hypothetical protein